MLALGPGVRSGLVGSAEAVGAEVGMDPRPPVAPVQAATSERTATSTRAMRMGTDRVMDSGSGYRLCARHSIDADDRLRIAGR